MEQRDRFAGGKLSEWIAAPGQKGKRAPLIVKLYLGKIAPPCLGVPDLIAPTIAAGINDGRLPPLRWLIVGEETGIRAVDEGAAPDDSRRWPGESVEK